MQNLLSKKEINQFQKDGAVFIKGKFDKSWIEKLRNGIDIDINNPSPRFVNHTKDSNLPGYYEDFWTWNLYPDFKTLYLILLHRKWPLNSWVLQELIW